MSSAYRGLGLWRHSNDAPEGKFLVLRRDGSRPDWPYFVLGARDPAAPAGLQAYARHASVLGLHDEYVKDVLELAREFNDYRAQAGWGDPDGRKHRSDHPLIIALMRGDLEFPPLVAQLVPKP